MKIDPHYQRQKCRTMALVLAVSRLGTSKDTAVGLSKMAIFSVFVFFDGYFSNTLEMRRALLRGDTQSVVGFSVIAKCVTLNDLEWLFRVKFCSRAGLAG